MAQKSIVFTLLAALAISQASARKCYTCWSSLDEDCLFNPNQEKNVVDCGGGSGTLFNTLKSSPKYSHFPSLLNNLGGSSSAAFESECASAVLTDIETGKTTVMRGCTPKFMNDNSFNVLFLAYFGLQVEESMRCDRDLCLNY